MGKNNSQRTETGNQGLGLLSSVHDVMAFNTYPFPRWINLGLELANGLKDKKSHGARRKVVSGNDNKVFLVIFEKPAKTDSKHDRDSKAIYSLLFPRA